MTDAQWPRPGRRRAGVIAAFVIVSLVGACGGSSSKPNADVRAREREVAVQDQIVQQWNRVEAARASVAAAKRKLAEQRQALAVAEAIVNRIQRVQQVLGYFGVTLEDLCGPNSGGAAQQHALDYLNLSCPSPDRWKIDHPQALQGGDLADQEEVVRLLNRVEAATVEVVEAERRLAKQRQVATVAEALLKRVPRVQQVLKSFGFTFDNVCTPVVANGNGTAQQEAQRLRESKRQQALDTLKVTCPRA